MIGGEDEFPPMSAAEIEALHEQHMSEASGAELRRYIALKEARDELKDKARRAVEHGIALEDCPAELREDRHFVNWYWAHSYEWKRTQTRTRSETAIAAANVGAAAKKTEKAERVERWNARAVELRKKWPKIKKDHLVELILEEENNAGFQGFGTNAIMRAVRVSDAK